MYMYVYVSMCACICTLVRILVRYLVFGTVANDLT